MKTEKLFYGWYVVFAGALMVAITTGVISNCFSQFVKPVCADLGLTRQQMSMNQTILSILNMVISLVWGSLYKRIRLHKWMVGCAFIMPVFYFCYSLVNGPMMFYVVTVLVGLSNFFVSLMIINFIIGNWFIKDRGTALGLMSMGTGIGGMIMNTVISRMILNNGWRWTYRTLAVMFIAVLVPCALVIREKPEDKGLKPYGSDEEKAGVSEEKGKVLTGIDYKDAVRMPQFWAVITSAVCMVLAITAFYQTVAPNLSDHGYSVTFAAGVTSACMAALAAGKVALGKLFDRFGVRTATTIAILFTMIGTLASLKCTYKLSIIFIVMGVGLGCSFGAICAPMITQKLFGMKDYNAIYGKMAAATGLGGAIGPMISGRVYDKTGSYDPMFLAGIVLCIISIALMRHYLPKQSEETQK